MIKGKQFRQMIDKFLQSPASQEARVQVQLPNGEFFDISEISLLENKFFSTTDSHRLVFKCEKSRHPMGKIIGKL
tara:strand:+ start:605 stop:829 length:225 start_codon:yes stop_codon:yes gene_type:complete